VVALASRFFDACDAWELCADATDIGADAEDVGAASAFDVTNGAMIAARAIARADLIGIGSSGTPVLPTYGYKGQNFGDDFRLQSRAMI
jgi:hypothetical protein